MMHTLLRRARSGAHDAGVAMIMVVGFTVIALTLMMVAAGIAVNSLGSSRAHVTFEQALDVAEKGVDQLLARLQNNQAYTYWGTGTAPVLPVTGTFSSPAAERDWARTEIVNRVTAGTLPLVTDDLGQYAAIKPEGHQAVYSMSWAPSFAIPDKSRLIKAEYLFAPWAPAKALLTGADLDFGGSVAINATGSGPADVHSNGDLEAPNSLEVQGSVTSSGTNTATAGGGKITGTVAGGEPLEDIPTIESRDVYDAQIGTYGGNYATTTGIAGATPYSGNWYDLCPDGSAKAPAAAGPCTGTVLSSSGDFREWGFTAGDSDTPPKWLIEDCDSSPCTVGVYYIYQGDAEMDMKGQDKDEEWNTTVITEAYQDKPGYTDADRCNRFGGDIIHKHATIRNYIPGLLMLAGTNYDSSSNENIYNGLVAVWGRIDLQTSSAGLSGAAVAANNCAASGPNNVQGITIKYDGNTEAPLTSVIRTTQWLEFTG